VLCASAAKRDKNHMDAFMPGVVDENELAREVRHQLITLPYYGVFDDLAFRLDGSTTLLGAVTQPVLKSDAENAVKRIKGVSRVIDNIEVQPLSPMDNQVRAAVYRAIYGDPTLSDRYGFRAAPSIHILVKNGNVVLEGVVANSMDKSIAGLRANGVPGCSPSLTIWSRRTSWQNSSTATNRHQLELTASRLAQYFFILAETSRRSSGDIDFLPRRPLAGAAVPAPGAFSSSKDAITLSNLSFSRRNSSMVLIKSISRPCTMIWLKEPTLQLPSEPSL
jgi:hyperosmotically inducible periplasmic protein